MGPFYCMVRVHLAQLVEHALRMTEGHGFESRRWLSLSGPFRVPAFLGIPCPYGSCQFAFYGQPGSRDELLALRAALCLRTFKQCGKGDKADGKQADSLAWMRKRCSLPAGLPDSFGIALQVWYTAVLLPRAKVPALGRRPDVVPDVVPQAAQPVLKTRHSLGPPMLDVPPMWPWTMQFLPLNLHLLY